MYKIMVEFYDIEKPKKGDILYINNKLFNDMKNNFVSFGLIEEDIDNNTINDEELIVIEKDNKKIYLKRYYG